MTKEQINKLGTEMEQTFKIVGRTNSWIAERDSQFKGKTEIIIADNLTLKEAQRKLLSMLNECYELGCSNWGAAVIATKSRGFCAYPTHEDGTRCFEYDGRTFSIEEED